MFHFSIGHRTCARGYDLSEYHSNWRPMYILHFLPLTYNGKVMKLTRPEVTDAKNPRCTKRRYLCPYCTLRVSKTLDLWCVFDSFSNFEKFNLRSGHLMWSGGVTFEVRRSKFSGNVSKCLVNSYAKFGGAIRRRFFAIHEKPVSVSVSPLPSPRPPRQPRKSDTWSYFLRVTRN